MLLSVPSASRETENMSHMWLWGRYGGPVREDPTSSTWRLSSGAQSYWTWKCDGTVSSCMLVNSAIAWRCVITLQFIFVLIAGPLLAVAVASLLAVEPSSQASGGLADHPQTIT